MSSQYLFLAAQRNLPGPGEGPDKARGSPRLNFVGTGRLHYWTRCGRHSVVYRPSVGQRVGWEASTMAVVGLVKELGDGLVVGEYGQSRGRSAAIPDLIEPGL